MKPEELKALRIKAGLTQQQAADMVHVARRSWLRYEAGERAAPKAVVELFKIKVGKQ